MNSNSYKPDDFFREIFAQPLVKIEYPYHPSEEILHSYMTGKLQARQDFSNERLLQLQKGHLSDWSRTEVSTHIMTCVYCSKRIQVLSAQSSERVAWWTKVSGTLSLRPIRRLLTPVPALARVVMAAQLVVIFALAGVIYFKPTPFFTTEISTTQSEPSAIPNMTKEALTEPKLPPQAAASQTALKQPAPVATSTSPASAPPSTTTLQTANTSALIPVLASQLKSSDQEQQIHAAQQLGALGDSQGVAPLIEAFGATSDSKARQYFARALGEIYEKTQDEYYQVIESFKSFQNSPNNSQGDHDLIKDLFNQIKIDLNLSTPDDSQYPHKIKISFHQDVTLHEVNSLAHAVGGVLVFSESSADELVLKLPQKTDDELKEIIRQFAQDPRVKAVQKIK
ncbi:hypothetical protein HY230_11520 [Candidatus Acetothermia bacterium]|nr:hypothetical protein [Candidatus Acetothermia bacterium]